MSLFPEGLDLFFRRTLVGTALGRILVHIRKVLDLLKAPRVELGTLINDQIAVKVLIDLCQPGDVFVDIGAHIGSVIAEVKHRCPRADVVAFEAIPSKAKWLNKKFPNVSVHSCALGERSGSVAFFIDLEESGYSSLAAPSHKFDKIEVSMMRLDDILERADYLKIDVEGAELGVLLGAEELISISRPIVMFESGPGSILSYTKSDLFSFFDRLDFGIMAPNRIAHTGGFMTLDAFLDSHEYPRRTTNYFAIPRERIDEVRKRANKLVC